MTMMAIQSTEDGINPTVNFSANGVNKHLLQKKKEKQNITLS